MSKIKVCTPRRLHAGTQLKVQCGPPFKVSSTATSHKTTHADYVIYCR